MTHNRVDELQRLRYWQGQKLLSRDFRDQVSYESELRWWHNRALHNAYGVSYGFQVTLDDTHVDINCGVAYDCYGRELILQVPKRMAVPEPDEKFERMTLVANIAAADQHITKREVLMGNVDCSSNRMTPVLQWKRSRCCQVVDGVPLAEISYEPLAPLKSLPPNIRFPPSPDQKIYYNKEKKFLIAIDGLTKDEAAELRKLSEDAAFHEAISKLIDAGERTPVLNAYFVQRRARALTRPRIGSGSTVAGDTAWELWTEIILDSRGHKVPADLGVQVTVDTSGAGFTETPCYFAWLQGTLWDQVHLNFFPVPIVHIDRETYRRFRFRLWMPSIIAVIGARLRYANVHPDFATWNTPSTPVNVGFLNMDTMANATANTRSQPRSFATDFVNFARQQKLYICWMGIQEMVQPTCDPHATCGCETSVPEEERQRTDKGRKRRTTPPARRQKRRLIVEDLR
ncbi:MAG TPA: hypothetical protein VFR78_20605 [Pyrinomonadaceae bacterium]|nr:hypothetical protein [Pyrinomonadaceae bacterium]